MDNLRGAFIMVLSMLGFALEDSFIKGMAGDLPVGQILALLGLGGSAIFIGVLKLQGQALLSRAMLTGPVVLRGFGELVGTIGFVTAISLTPLSSASAILQATPLVVTLGAALFLQEQVGWRRWTAILVGFFGVILIIRPGMEGFDWKSLFAVQGVLGLAIRDLATRRVKADVTSMQLSFLAFLLTIPSGLFLLLLTGSPMVVPTPWHWTLMAGAVAVGVISYLGIVIAMRVGEISFVTPFRYSRMIFALALGIVVFGERPDGLTLAGTAIIVASGIYTVWRERKTRSAARASLSIGTTARYDAVKQ